jgi:V-type H+-transporting ATPase subunit C
MVDSHKERGRVVPGSRHKVTDDNDSILYTVTILRSQYELGYLDSDAFQSGTNARAPMISTTVRYDPLQPSKSAIALE